VIATLAETVGWVGAIFLFSLCLRTILLPLAWRSFWQSQTLAMISSLAMRWHNEYKDQPKVYAEKFEHIRSRLGIKLSSPFLNFFFLMIPLAVAGIYLFQLDINGITQYGLSLDARAIYGSQDAWAVVLALTVAIIAISAWSTRNLDEDKRKYRWAIIIAPAAFQFVFALFLPLYFNIYVFSALAYGQVQNAIFRKIWPQTERYKRALEFLEDE
jgi:membrane protein insertase Oxa1/YidC/SpoIIIJ